MEKKTFNYCNQITTNKYKVSIENGQISLPLLQSVDGSQWQLAILCYNQQNNQILIENLEQVNQLLCNDNDIQKVAIRTYQTSKLGKKHKEKLDVLITKGKNIGKKNETTKLQQAIFQCNNKYEKMYQKKSQNNTIPHLMLLDTFKYKENMEGTKRKNKELKYPQYIQRKYDGLRCCAVQQFNATNGYMQDIILYSRGQKEYTNLKHLNRQLYLLLQQYYQTLSQIHTQQTMTIDGELYMENINLQEINGIVRSDQTNTEHMQLNIFDVDITDGTSQLKIPFVDRLHILNELNTIITTNKKQFPNLCVIQTVEVNNIEYVEQLLIKYLEEGYEGLVLRDPQSLYIYSINSKRSKDTLKYKPRFDTEVNVIGFSDGQGKDTGAIVWNCVYQSKNLNIVQNTTLEIRKQQYQALQTETLLMETLKKIPFEIQYSVLSNDNIPQQPRGIRFRFDLCQEQINEDQVVLFKQLNLM